MNMQTILLGRPVVAALVGTRWSLSLIIGQLQSTEGLGLPLAMFSPSGGVAKVPPWFPAGWAAAGALNVPLEVQFSAKVLSPIASYLGEIEGIKKLHDQRQKRLIDFDYYKRKVAEMVKTPPKDS